VSASHRIASCRVVSHVLLVDLKLEFARCLTEQVVTTIQVHDAIFQVTFSLVFDSYHLRTRALMRISTISRTMHAMHATPTSSCLYAPFRIGTVPSDQIPVSPHRRPDQNRARRLHW
jgi:hypothetical protein